MEPSVQFTDASSRVLALMCCSSRSVCANLAEAWRKRRYRAAFIAKLNDAESEASETLVWLEMAWSCKYLNESDFERLSSTYDHIIAQIVRMIMTADHWVIPGKK